MRISVAMQKNVLRVRLGESLDIASAVEARNRLLQVSQSSPHLDLDLSSLSDIDTAGIQILLALVQERTRRGAHTRMVHPSQPVLDAFGLLGLQHIFDEAVVVPRENAA